MGRLGLGLVRSRRFATPTYDNAADAYFEAMSTPPAATRKTLLNTLIVGLKADGVWAKLDWLSLFAAHDAQAARVNAVNPELSFSEVNAPDFVPDMGYAGSTSGAIRYLDSGWNPSSDAAAYAQDSAHMAVWSLTDSVGYSAGAINEGVWAGVASRVASPPDWFIGIANDASGWAGIVDTAVGFSAWDRSASNAVKLYRDGAVITDGAGAASTGLPTNDFHACGINPALTPGFPASVARLAAICWGGHLTDAEHLALHTRLNTYLTAVEAV